MEAVGYAAEEVQAEYARARELCLELDDREQLVPVLLGLSTIAEVSARYREADEIACELIRLADEGIGPRGTALTARGWSLLCMGRLAEVVDCLAPLVQAPEPDPEQPIGRAHDAVEALCISAWAVWFLGRPDEASRQSNEAIALAHRVDHPFSVMFATTCDAFFRQLRGECERAAQRAHAALAVAEKNGYPLWGAWASIVLGWATSTNGESDAGIAQIRSGLAASSETGSLWARSYLLGILASAAVAAARPDEALAALEEAAEIAAAHEEVFYESELRRLRGEIFLAGHRPDASAAEEAFRGALTIARDQQNRSLELRAATSLASLWRSQGRFDEAASVLRGVYECLVEGFDTPDMLAARALLDEAEAANAQPGDQLGS